MTDEYYINLWVEFNTDSVAERMEIMMEIKDVLNCPDNDEFKLSGMDGMEVSYHDDDYIHPDDISDLVARFEDKICAYEYNVDEVVYTNIHHLYRGD